MTYTVDLHQPDRVAHTPQARQHEEHEALLRRGPPAQHEDEDAEMQAEGKDHHGLPSGHLDDGARGERGHGVRHAEADHDVADVADPPRAGNEGLRNRRRKCIACSNYASHLAIISCKHAPFASARLL